LIFIYLFIYWLWIKFILYFKSVLSLFLQWRHHYSFILLLCLLSLFYFLIILLHYSLQFSLFFRCFSFLLHTCSSSLLFHLLASLPFLFVYLFLIILYFTTLYHSVIFFSFLSFRLEDYFFSFWHFCNQKVGVFLFVCLSVSLCLPVRM